MEQLPVKNKYIKPVKHDFISYLRASDISESEIEQIIKYLVYKTAELKTCKPVYLAVQFAIETVSELSPVSNRDAKKQQCYYLYRKMEKSSLPRAEKIKFIADKMNLKRDCIQVYLREMTSEAENLNPKNPE